MRAETAPGLWGRIGPILPYLVTLALFVAGLAALYHLLHGIALDEVHQQVRRVSASHLGAALVATMIGYGAMACYDWTALRYIGRYLPARIVALGGFLAYSIGNTVGISPLSGGAVRYRVYAVLGLGLGDIARISGFVALAYGVGATLIGLGALVIWPDSLGGLLPLPPALVRALAIIGFVLGNLLIWGAGFRGGRLRLGRWSIDAPAPGLMATQLGITLIEMLMGALVLHLLLIDADLPFMPFLALYLAATLAGILSHVPGGVGVFETVILAVLSTSVPKVEVAAALLLYRLIYYILPFALALALMAVLEARNWLTGRVTAWVRALTMGLVPVAMGVMVMASGAVMILAPIVPPTWNLADDAQTALPLPFATTGALLSTILGVVLILIAQGLLRRLSGAWWLTMAALVAGTVATLFDGFDTRRAMLLAVAALLLLPCRGAFYRATRLTKGALSPGWLVLVGAMLASVLLLWFLAPLVAPYQHEPPWRFADNPLVPPMLRLALIGGVALTLVSVWHALRRVPRMTGRQGRPDRDRLAAISARWGRAEDALAPIAGAEFMMAESGDAFIAYLVQGRSWVALGDPIGDPARIPGLIWAFRDAARRARRVPVFYQLTRRWLPQWIETGMTLYRIGEEAVIDLARLPADWPARDASGADQRADQDAGSGRLSFQLLPADQAGELLPDCQRQMGLWSGAGWARRGGVAAGWPDGGWPGGTMLAIARDGGRVVAFAVVLVDGARRQAVIGLFRQVPGASSRVQEFLFAELASGLAAKGFIGLGLGIAPLAGFRSAPGLAGRIGRLVHRLEGQDEGVATVRAAIDALAPQWEMRYLALPRLANAAGVMADLARLLSGRARRPDPAFANEGQAPACGSDNGSRP